MMLLVVFVMVLLVFIFIVHVSLFVKAIFLVLFMLAQHARECKQTHRPQKRTHTRHIEKLRSPVRNLFVLMLAIMHVLLGLMLAIMLMRDMRLRPLIHHPCLPKEGKV